MHAALGAEAEDDSSAKTKVVLAIVQAVGKLGEKVFGLLGTDGDVAGYSDVNATASGHGKLVLRSQASNPIGR